MSPAAPGPAPTGVARPRLDGPDLLRGLAMVLMALDHARDFFSPTLTAGGWGDPASLPDVSPALFFTRWVTHFCAPVFVFLAGAGACLYGSRGRTPAQVSWFLLTRGLWLVALEWTVVLFGWTFAFPPPFLVAQVLWALGVSMVVLAALCRLPRAVVAAVGLVLVGGHDAFTGGELDAAALGAVPWRSWEALWGVLHVQGSFVLFTRSFGMAVVYPVLPWIGAMALGYAAGSWLQRSDAAGRRRLLFAGAAATAGFVLLRASNAYGDPRPWEPGATPVRTLIDFLNCAKYPPSLCFLLMTLGPAWLFLVVADRLRERPVAWVVTFGRVPLLFYVLHVYALSLASSLLAVARFGPEAFAFGVLNPGPPELPIGLPGAYAAWLTVLVVLYPPCRWFARVKQRSRSPWLSYL